MLGASKDQGAISRTTIQECPNAERRPWYPDFPPLSTQPNTAHIIGGEHHYMISDHIHDHSLHLYTPEGNVDPWRLKFLGKVVFGDRRASLGAWAVSRADTLLNCWK